MFPPLMDIAALESTIIQRTLDLCQAIVDKKNAHYEACRATGIARAANRCARLRIDGTSA